MRGGCVGYGKTITDHGFLQVMSEQRRTEHRIPDFSFKAIIMSCWFGLDTKLFLADEQIFD